MVFLMKYESKSLIKYAKKETCTNVRIIFIKKCMVCFVLYKKIYIQIQLLNYVFKKLVLISQLSGK